MVKRRQSCLSNVLEEIDKRHFTVNLVSQGDCVEVEADLILEVRMAASRNRAAYDEVCLPGVFVEQDIKRREQGHEQAGVMPASQQPESFQLVSREVETQFAS